MYSPQSSANADQETYWNTSPGKRWVEFQEILDSSMQAASERLLKHAKIEAGERVLDIGCGAGAATMAAASAVGAGGSVLGADISSALLERAEERRRHTGIENVEYIQADAQTHAFAEGTFDVLISRFGVMFFADPVAAFRNMRRALRPGGRLAFVSWASVDDNPWFHAPHKVAVALLGSPPPVPPRAPGPLAFAEPDYPLGILRDAGFADCSVESEEFHLVHDGGLDEITHLAMFVGPAARIANAFEASEEQRSAIAERIRDVFQPFVTDNQVRIPARINAFSAVVG